MRAVVTGGAGFIGSHVCDALGTSGAQVLAIDNLSSGTSRLPFLEKAGVRLSEADIRDEQSTKTVRDFRPDVLIHLAAQMDVRRSVEDPAFDASVNVLGTINMLEAAKASGARFVFASSGGCIYGEPDPIHLPIDESYEGSPVSPYGISKKVAEEYLRFYSATFGVPFVSLALANVYGPRQDPHGEAGVVSIFGNKLLSGEDCVIFGDGKQTRDFVFVEDVATAFLLAVEKGEGNTINISTARETSVEQLYGLMSGMTGVDRPPVYRDARPGELLRSSLSNRKAEELLGWRPQVALEDGLQSTIDFFHSSS